MNSTRVSVLVLAALFLPAAAVHASSRNDGRDPGQSTLADVRFAGTLLEEKAAAKADNKVEPDSDEDDKLEAEGLLAWEKHLKLDVVQEAGMQAGKTKKGSTAGTSSEFANKKTAADEMQPEPVASTNKYNHEGERMKSNVSFSSMEDHRSLLASRGKAKSETQEADVDATSAVCCGPTKYHRRRCASSKKCGCFTSCDNQGLQGYQGTDYWHYREQEQGIRCKNGKGCR